MAKKRDSKGKFIKQGNLVSDDIFIPNHSGTHDAGTTSTPTADDHLVNKKYVDDALPSAGLWEVDGTETQLIIADEIDMQTKTQRLRNMSMTQLYHKHIFTMI